MGIHGYFNYFICRGRRVLFGVPGELCAIYVAAVFAVAARNGEGKRLLVNWHVMQIMLNYICWLGAA